MTMHVVEGKRRSTYIGTWSINLTSFEAVFRAVETKQFEYLPLSIPVKSGIDTGELMFSIPSVTKSFKKTNFEFEGNFIVMLMS